MTRAFYRVLLSFAAACCFGSAAKAQTIQAHTIQVWQLGPATMRDYMSHVAIEFEKQHPGVTVKVQMYPNEAYKQQIQIGLQSPTPPDIFYYWPGERTAALVRAGAVADLSAFGGRPGWWNERIPSQLLQGFQVDGRQYGVPFEAFGYDMYYNTSLYASQGLTVPTTLEDLVALCAVSRAKAPAVAPLALGNSERWMLVHLISLWNQRMVGAEKVRQDYALEGPADQLFTDPGYVAALQVALKLRDAKCFNAGPNATSPDVALALFNAGRAASMQLSPAYLDAVRAGAVKGKLGMYRFPAIAGGKGSQDSLSATESALLVSAASTNKETAAAFVNFMTSDAMQADLLKSGRIPANMRSVDVSALPEDVRMSLADTAAAKALVLSIDNVATAGVADAFMNGGQELLNGSLSPEQVMERVRASASADLAKRGH